MLYVLPEVRSRHQMVARNIRMELTPVERRTSLKVRVWVAKSSTVLKMPSQIPTGI
eukprot:CAMPEP_0172029034 /NCGR_PEP_ID=MMETSP1041-20130122/17912_1 /TAXON_ID=464988 /ORGANISM="Hemiselmis andersenii, Strain CCMP439" /LENGTH=55 /DNA_ID=CAMNT_0012685163 /DNA_START=52 /DNA_END=216 /DNA_ORIENTATION=+